tara:strand:+ start:1024 stop:1308 length:285 start_codon:yes stop_codon:yes gene_type:complete
VLIGFAGGALAELAQWFRIRKELAKTGVPDYSRSYLYWILTFAMIAVGGLLVWIYESTGTDLNLFLALNIGASAPLIIEGLVGQAPPVDPGSVD